jgi:hypothetical protein
MVFFAPAFSFSPAAFPEIPAPASVAVAPTTAGQATPLNVYAILTTPPAAVSLPGMFAVAGFDLSSARRMMPAF